MLKGRHFIFVICVVALLNESHACFRSNEHQKTVITTGSSYYQECQCTEPGFTVENLKWLDIHDQPIEPGPGTNKVVYTEETQDSINLYIPSISKSMSGMYKCITEVKGVKYVQSYTIDAYEPLYFFKTPNDQYLTLERDSTIACEARGESLPRISWQKKVDDEFVDILPNPEKYVTVPQGLLVKNVSKDDGGEYKCTALVISTGEEVDKFIAIDIKIIPVIEKLIAYPSSTVIAGELLSIDCVAEGVPASQYAWKKFGNDSNNNITWTQKVNTIYFDSISADDEGIYECLAYNDAGGTTKNITVEVLVPPTVTYFPNITEVEGTTVQLICNATGKPEPNITVIYEGWDVKSDWELSEYEIIPNKAFATLQRSSEGIYVCNASNEVGYVMTAMYLTVLHRPYFKDDNNRAIEWGYDGKIVKLSCALDSNPPASITWRFESNDIPTEEEIEISKSLLDHMNDMREQYLTLNIDKNTTYGMYTCTAKNDLGEATKVVTLKEGFRPPVIETIINITDITATTVTFQIEGPFREDIPEILGYTAQYDEEWNYEITDIHPNRTWSVDRPYKIERLKPNTTYYVSFAAVNEVGAGEFGNHMEFITLEKSVPESPVLEEESLQRSSNGNHLLKWKESEDNGEPIDYYVLKYCPVNNSVYEESDGKLCEVRHIAPATELELPDLESNTTYYLELIAHNAEGNSTPANISITIPTIQDEDTAPLLSGGAIIGISILIVLFCLLLLDLLLLAWKRQGIIAVCCFNKDNKKKEDALNSRDKKGLLIIEPIDTRSNNGHREYEYNKNTGIVTGKHSAV